MVNRRTPFTIYDLLFTSFARLQFDRHARITNALAFVSVRLAQLVHLGRDLSELLLVDARQRQRGLILLNTALGSHTLGLRLNSIRQRKVDRMRITKRENN